MMGPIPDEIANLPNLQAEQPGEEGQGASATAQGEAKLPTPETPPLPAEQESSDITFTPVEDVMEIEHEIRSQNSGSDQSYDNQGPAGKRQ